MDEAEWDGNRKFEREMSLEIKEAMRLERLAAEGKKWFDEPIIYNCHPSEANAEMYFYGKKQQRRPSPNKKGKKPKVRSIQHGDANVQGNSKVNNGKKENKEKKGSKEKQQVPLWKQIKQSFKGNGVNKSTKDVQSKNIDQKPKGNGKSKNTFLKRPHVCWLFLKR